jgi:hypothetical protein
MRDFPRHFYDGIMWLQDGLYPPSKKLKTLLTLINQGDRWV